MSDNLEEREEMVGDPEVFGRIQSYNRKMLLLFLVLFCAAGPFVVSRAVKEYGFAESVSWVFVILAGFNLSLIISDELSLQNFGAKIRMKGKKLTLIDAINQPDEFRRAVFHQRLQAFLSLFFVLPATILSSFKIILNWTDFREFSVVLCIWFFFWVVSGKIADWIAVKKFGEVEGKEQEERKEIVRERRKVLTSMKGRRGLSSGIIFNAIIPICIVLLTYAWNIARLNMGKTEIKPSTTSAAAIQELNSGRDMIEERLHDMVEFDYAQKGDIYKLREAAVAEHPELADSNYVPSDNVFGQIASDRPWWGILGFSYYGRGNHSIDGPSEESRFIVNPFLLVALDARIDPGAPNSSVTPHPVYPLPQGLWWRRDRKLAIVRYDVGSFLTEANRVHPDRRGSFNNINLIAYNARDFGYNYLYISPQESENITAAAKPVPLIQYIHVGGSCGYPGGCNNMSPAQMEMIITVNALPAIAYIKLWKTAPATVTDPADMIFAIEMD